MYNTNNSKYYVFGGGGDDGVKVHLGYDGKSWKIIEGTNHQQEQALPWCMIKSEIESYFWRYGKSLKPNMAIPQGLISIGGVKVTENGPGSKKLHLDMYAMSKKGNYIFGGLGKRSWAIPGAGIARHGKTKTDSGLSPE